MFAVKRASRHADMLRQHTPACLCRFYGHTAAQEQFREQPKETRNVPQRSIKKLLVANRGEIACRIMRTAQKVGVRTVAVYSDADKNSMHVRMADESVNIGAAPALESYLNGERILRAAHALDVEAIHPGYGFLSENEKFCRQCADDGIIFVGPPPTAMRDMGLKDASKRIVSGKGECRRRDLFSVCGLFLPVACYEQFITSGTFRVSLYRTDAGVPVVPGYHGEDQSIRTLKREADKIGYPLMIKAVRGGGGKGMRIAMTANDFESALESAKTEARKSFGDDQVLLEKYVQRPRHIEVQVFGDQHGNYVYLFERDCSVQRRHQKIIEEAPAPNISPEIRRRIGEAAVKVAQAVGYYNAGTVEFIVDTDQKFYFMEMNTRLQVEHPITEMITSKLHLEHVGFPTATVLGLRFKPICTYRFYFSDTDTDLVDWQLQVAAGRPLPLRQDEIKLNGHAFECRIYAEDADNGFMPSPGQLTYLSQSRLESLNNVRVETGVQQGDNISVFYDPMISKLVAWGPDREAALNRMKYVLRRYQVGGVATNVEFLLRLCEHPSFVVGDVHTDFIPQHRASLFDEPKQRAQKSDVRRENLAKASLSALTLLSGQHSVDNTHSQKSAMDLLPKSAQYFRTVSPLRETFTFIDDNAAMPSSTDTEQKSPTKKSSSSSGKAAQNQNNLNVHVSRAADAVNPSSSWIVRVGDDDANEILVADCSCRPISQQSAADSGRLIRQKPMSKCAEFSARCGNVDWRWTALLDADGGVQLFSLSGPTAKLQLQTNEVDSTAGGGGVAGGAAGDRAVMPGVVEKVLVSEGDVVKEGQTIMVMIAMKMEYTIKAPCAGVLKRLMVKPGANVNKGDRLFEITES